jgi:hypothetical protein
MTGSEHSNPLDPDLRSIPPIAWVLLGSALAWGILIAVIPPELQDFPLDDDWAFGKSARLFAATGEIHYLNWASMPQLGQWLWAVPFLKFDDSYFALRLSTIVLGWLGLWAFYDLLRGEGITAGRAALATAALAANPLFFLLQGTFMTDVPALALALVALALYRRAFARGSVLPALAGCAVALLAVTTRQNMVTVALVAWMLLWRSPFRWRLVYLGTVLAPMAGAIATHLWFQTRHDIGPVNPGIPPPHVVLLLPYMVVHYAGLSGLPLLLLMPRPPSWKGFLWLLGFLLLNALYWGPALGHELAYGGHFPYRHNLLSPWGAFAGPLHPVNAPLFQGIRPIILTAGIRLTITLIGCVAGALLLTKSLSRFVGGFHAGPILWFTAWQVPFILIALEIHDRYLLMLLPGALVLAAYGNHASKLTWRLAIAAVIGTGAISACLMHDWLAWNSARWSLGRHAVEQGAKPEEIEGGFEWDGWHRDGSQGKPAVPLQGLALESLHRWFPTVTGKYALSFSELPNSVIVASEPYSLWLKPGPHHFFLLRYQPTRPDEDSVPGLLQHARRTDAVPFSTTLARAR